GDRAAERVVQLGDARAQDVREADEQRQADAALLHLVDELLQVNRPGAGAGWRADDVALVVDAEIAAAPAPHTVRLQRVGDRPVAGHAPRRVNHLSMCLHGACELTPRVYSKPAR